MTSQSRQDRIDDLFARAVELPAAERQTFLNEATNGDAEVLAEVQKLLVAHEKAEQSTDFLAAPPTDDRLYSGRALAHQPLIGQRIGPYEVKRLIGSGGFGQVYFAFRSDDYKQKVAIKVLRSDIDVDERTLARFELERQLLADLHHDNIARLLYGGTLESGRPYIVMEYVKGQPLTEYCDGKRLSITERLAIFRQVCEAVAYAHRYSTIHRDIKPGNILVTDDGTVKLLDFGIAKMVDPISQRRIVTISEGGMPLTPEYASPEQVRGEGISTASDVYSLGVVLYELLTGRRPYDFHRFTAAEIERVICEEEPRKPSTIVLEPVRIRRADCTDEVRSSQTLAEPRSTDPQRLNRALKGDLEQIILMALRKSPSRRYQSVEALLEDLDHFDHGQTIVARPVGRVERTWRWCKRRPATAALLGLLLFVAIVGPIVALQQAALRNQATRLAAASEQALGAKEQALAAREQALEELAKKNSELQSQLVRNLIERGLAQCEAGHVSHGIVLFAEANQKASVDDPLRASTRNLAATWSSKVGFRKSLEHNSSVLAVAFSPDSRTAITGSWESGARLWDVATGKLLSTRILHGSGVVAVAISPNGRFAVTGSRDNTARLWDAATGESIGEPMRHTGFVVAVAFSPDSQILMTGSNDNTARLWDTATGKAMSERMYHRGPVLAVAFSPDGRVALTGSRDGTAHLWDATTGKPLGEPMRHGGMVNAIAFNPDGHLALTGSEDNSARLWDATTGKPFSEPLQHESGVLAVAFSPDGRSVLTGSTDRAARLWDTATGKLLCDPLKHAESVVAVAFSPDGRTVLTGSYDGTAQLWDAKKGKPLGEPMFHYANVNAVAFSPDGRTVLTGSLDHTAALWDTMGAERVRLTLDLGTNAMAFSADGRFALAQNRDTAIPLRRSQTARLWDVTTGKPLGESVKLDLDGRIQGFSPDGRIAVISVSRTSKLLLDTATSKPLSPKIGDDSYVTTLAISSNGRMLLTADDEKSARLWDVATGKPLGEPIRHDGRIHAMAFSPNDHIILTASDDNTARLWDTVSLKPLGEPMLHKQAVRFAIFSPDGRMVLTRSDDQIVRLWDATTGKPLGEPIRDDLQWYSLTFSPDSRTILVAGPDNTARFWDTATEKPRGEPIRHDDRILSRAFSPDSCILFTGSADKTARLWDVATGKPMGEPMRHEGRVLGVAFAADGGTILTGSSDDTIHRWELRHLPENPALIRSWAEAKTGMSLDAQGLPRRLAQAEWLRAQHSVEKIRRDLPDKNSLSWMDGPTSVNVHVADGVRNSVPNNDDQFEQLLAQGSFFQAMLDAVRKGPDAVNQLMAAAIARDIGSVPRSIDGVVLGELLIIAGHPDRAEAAIQAAIRNPANTHYYYKSLGWCLLAEKKAAESRKAFERVLKELRRPDGSYDLEIGDPDHRTAAYFLDFLTEQQYTEKLASDKKFACFPWFYVGQRHEIEGKKDAAISAYLRCVELGTTNSSHPVSALAEWRLRKLKELPEHAKK